MNRINKGNLIWFLVLLSFSLFLIYLLLSGKIYTFINPEMVKYTEFGLFGFAVLTVFEFTRIFAAEDKNKVRAGYLLFLLPLILGITNNGFNVSIADKKNVTVAERQVSKKSELKILNVVDKEKHIKDKYIKNGKVYLDEKNYYGVLNDIGENLDRYVDKEIELIGFVYRNNNFENNNFVVARMLMTCCAADAQVVGIMSEYSHGEELVNGDWVKVRGIIKCENYKGLNGKTQRGMAVIHVKNVTSVKKPYSEYIYPKK